METVIVVTKQIKRNFDGAMKEIPRAAWIFDNETGAEKKDESKGYFYYD